MTGTTPTSTSEETADDDITGQRSRPSGNTADHVNEAGHKKFMANLKGILKHHQQDIKDERWLRFVVGTAIGRDVAHIGELDQTLRDKAWAWLTKQPVEAFINMDATFRQIVAVSE